MSEKIIRMEITDGHGVRNSFLCLNEVQAINLYNALKEWDETVGPKELEPHEDGLDAERFDAIMDGIEALVEGRLDGERS